MVNKLVNKSSKRKAASIVSSNCTLFKHFVLLTISLSTILKKQWKMISDDCYAATHLSVF